MVRRRGEAPLAPPGIVPSDKAQQDEGCFIVMFPYGFIDEDGIDRFWYPGQKVRDPDELALLQARGVNLEED